MRILYATRLFSGLESSFINRKWVPTGVPTIYRIIEELDRRHDASFIFSAKDTGPGYCSTWTETSDYNGPIEGLKHKIRVLAGTGYFSSWFPRKLSMILRDVRQSALVVAEAIRFKPDIVYCDHANVMAAAIIARFVQRSPVLFRVMGVYPFMKQTLKPKNPVQWFYRWAYRSPYTNVICTQDGSGVEEWLQKGLHPDTKVEIFLNGTDPIALPEQIDEQLLRVPLEKPIVLYVGKLEVYKGCNDFVYAILQLLDQQERNLHALVIGTGNEEERLNALVKENGYVDYFTFIKRLPHRQIYVAHDLSDIYVSMNSLGNLSNSNLEAICSDECMIFPDPQLETGIDVITSKLLGDTIVTVPKESPERLAVAIAELLHSPAKRDRMSQAIHERKQWFLWTWDERIIAEIDLLERVLDEHA